MNKKKAGRKRRGVALPLAIVGLLAGLGAAYFMMRWQRRNMPWTLLDRGTNELSIYEVRGDVTKDWPMPPTVAAAGDRPAPADAASNQDSTFDGIGTGIEY